MSNPASASTCSTPSANPPELWSTTGTTMFASDVAVPANQALKKAHELAIQKVLEKTKDDRQREMIQMDAEHSRDLQAGKTGPMSK